MCIRCLLVRAFRLPIGVPWVRAHIVISSCGAGGGAEGVQGVRYALPLVVVVVVVLTLTRRYNAVRGHRTGSNNSGAENYLRKTNNNGR